MTDQQKVTVPVPPTTRRPSSAQRLAAHAASISTKQAELKREAAERRAKRASDINAPAAAIPRTSASARSPNAR